MYFLANKDAFVFENGAWCGENSVLFNDVIFFWFKSQTNPITDPQSSADLNHLRSADDPNFDLFTIEDDVTG